MIVCQPCQSLIKVFLQNGCKTLPSGRIKLRRQIFFPYFVKQASDLSCFVRVAFMTIMTIQRATQNAGKFTIKKALKVMLLC